MNHGEPAADSAWSDMCDARRAIEVLRAGGVVALPTDTVYGLAASLDHPEAIERIFSIKGRSGTKAIPILVSQREVLERLSRGRNPLAEKLAAAFWPGGLTIVVEAGPNVPDAVVRGGETVGVRMPDHALALEIIDGVGGALAVTSANRSGEMEATTPDEVHAKLGNRVDMIVDGGSTPGTRPSTVVDTTGHAPRVLREGAISRGEIRDVLGVDVL